MFTNGPLRQPAVHPPVSIDLLAAVAVKTPVFFCKFARMNVLTIRCVDSQTRRLRRVC